MKKQLTLLFAFVLMLMGSCQKDTDIGKDKIVDCSITTSLPNAPSTYSRTGSVKNSAGGGLENVEQTAYDLRYIMEVWTTGSNPKKVLRKELIYDNNWKSNTVTFDAPLIAQEYDFVFWADFISQGSGKNLHYNADELNNIKFIEPYKVSDNARDAYFYKERIDLSISSNNIKVSLKRPFTKVRFIATDNSLNPDNVPTSSTVVYPNTALFYTAFNAFTGEAIGDGTVRHNTDLTATPTKEVNPSGNGGYLLVFDYILPSNIFNQINSVGINTSINGTPITYPCILNIPIVANTLVTLKGNFYTQKSIGNHSLTILDI